MTTSPSSATVLHPGDEVEVTATWNTADWPRPVLHKVLDCLLVNGEVDYDHSSQEKPTDNDGYYRYRFTVPNGARGRICDRVRLSGRFVEDGDLVVQKSNTICFSIAAVAGNTGGPGPCPVGPAFPPGRLLKSRARWSPPSRTALPPNSSPPARPPTARFPTRPSRRRRSSCPRSPSRCCLGRAPTRSRWCGSAPCWSSSGASHLAARIAVPPAPPSAPEAAGGGPGCDNSPGAPPASSPRRPRPGRHRAGAGQPWRRRPGRRPPTPCCCAPTRHPRRRSRRRRRRCGSGSPNRWRWSSAPSGSSTSTGSASTRGKIGTAAGRREVVVPADLAGGTYTVTWRIVSTDGHRITRRIPVLRRGAVDDLGGGG